MSPQVESVLSAALWLAAVAHGCAMLAGSQAPARLNWRQDLAQLTPFNRQIFWTYYGFVGGTVATFGILTAALHEEMLRGDRAALAVAAFIGTFWTARLVVDAVWYRHAGWPKGVAYAIGHVLLLVAFSGMAGTYWALLVAHALA